MNPVILGVKTENYDKDEILKPYENYKAKIKAIGEETWFQASYNESVKSLEITGAVINIMRRRREPMVFNNNYKSIYLGSSFEKSIDDILTFFTESNPFMIINADKICIIVDDIFTFMRLLTRKKIIIENNNLYNLIWYQMLETIKQYITDREKISNPIISSGHRALFMISDGLLAIKERYNDNSKVIEDLYYLTNNTIEEEMLGVVGNIDKETVNIINKIQSVLKDINSKV